MKIIISIVAMYSILANTITAEAPKQEANLVMEYTIETAINGEYYGLNEDGTGVIFYSEDLDNTHSVEEGDLVRVFYGENPEEDIESVIKLDKSDEYSLGVDGWLVGK